MPMPDLPMLIVLTVIAALVFDFINGFHDTANAIATVVSTRVLSPRVAILMASVLNFAGALLTTGVAKTVAGGLVDAQAVDPLVVLSAVVGAIIWNLITWYYGIPSSSSHALFGGICGAGLAFGGPDIILWKGVVQKVLIPIVASPLGGFLIGLIVMKAIYILFANSHPGGVGKVFRHMQVFSAGLMALSHGSNDSQKSMGIITMALVSRNLLTPADPTSPDIPLWVILSCAVMMALGTSMGGWRIIKTMGHRIIRLEPVHGFAAETSASAVIMLADYFHTPISTTQVISGSIFGVGASKRLSAVRWGVAEQMFIAWILTLPASGGFAAATYYILRACGVS
jgi:inorganic phosphate transporter, PiT family